MKKKNKRTAKRRLLNMMSGGMGASYQKNPMINAEEIILKRKEDDLTNRRLCLIRLFSRE